MPDNLHTPDFIMNPILLAEQLAKLHNLSPYAAFIYKPKKRSEEYNQLRIHWIQILLKNGYSFDDILDITGWNRPFLNFLYKKALHF